MRKKLFAVIMSAMMLITFMPTMAFADGITGYTVTGWGADYKTVTVKASNEKSYTVPTKIQFHATNDATANAGQYTAIPDFADSALEGLDITAEAVAHFYDLSKAVFTNGLRFSSMDYNDFKTLFDLDDTLENEISLTSAVKFVHKAATDDTPAVQSGTVDLTGYTMKIAKPVYDSTKAYEDQVFEGLQAYVVRTAGDEVVVKSKASADAINTLPVRKITVNGDVPSFEKVKFSIDKFKTNGDAITTITYDGKEHAVVDNKIPTVSITKYELLNPKTGKYEEVTSPAVKDKGTYSFKMTVKVGNKDPKTKTFVAVVNPVKVSFTLPTSATVYESVKYDLEDLVKFATADANTSKAELEAFLKTNKKLLKEFLDSFYTFTSTKNNVLGDTGLTVKMTLKTDEEVLAAKKKYNELFGQNIIVTNLENLQAEYSCAVTVSPIQGNELVACSQSKTFHVKKAKALKAKKTFKMKNDYVKIGSASYFKKSGNSKIVIAKDGKVTVKKGLKKGTYKVKIKVVAPNSPLQLSDNKTLTVKVVK